MLDIATSIDNSFLHAQVAPSFSTMAVATVDADGRNEFERNLNQRLSEYVSEFESWSEQGIAEASSMESALKQPASGLDPEMVERLVLLSKVLAKRAESIAENSARHIKLMRKQVKAFARHSKPASEFLKAYIPRIEKAIETEIEFVIDMSDLYRALARTYDPRNKRSEVFENADDLISYLKTA